MSSFHTGRHGGWWRIISLMPVIRIHPVRLTRFQVMRAGAGGGTRGERQESAQVVLIIFAYERLVFCSVMSTVRTNTTLITLAATPRVPPHASDSHAGPCGAVRVQ